MEKEEEGRVELKLLDVKLTFADLPVVTGACRALGSALHSRHLPSPPGKRWGLCYTRTPSGTSSGRTSKTTMWCSTVSVASLLGPGQDSGSRY